MPVGEIVKRLRKKNGLTQRELAEKLGLAPTAVSAWERGANNPMMDSLAMMSELFDVPIHYFYGLDEENYDKQTYKNVIPIPANLHANLHESSYPYITTPISAGLPETVEGASELTSMAVPDSIMGKYAGHADIRMMRVNGESMNRVIPNGSLIAVKKLPREQIKNGDIVVYNDNYEYAVKRMYQVEDKVIFRPDSTDLSFTDYVTDADENLDIVGKVVVYIVELD